MIILTDMISLLHWFCSLLIAPKQDIIMLSGSEYLNNDSEVY